MVWCDFDSLKLRSNWYSRIRDVRRAIDYSFQALIKNNMPEKMYEDVFNIYRKHIRFSRLQEYFLLKKIAEKSPETYRKFYSLYKKKEM